MVSTNEAEVDQLLIASDVAGHVRLTVSFGAGRGGYPSSPMGAVALARQAMLDADWYRKAWQAYRSQPSLPQPENNSALAAIGQWIESNKPIIFDTQNEQSAMRADQYAREFGLPRHSPWFRSRVSIGGSSGCTQSPLHHSRQLSKSTKRKHTRDCATSRCKT